MSNHVDLNDDPHHVPLPLPTLVTSTPLPQHHHTRRTSPVMNERRISQNEGQEEEEEQEEQEEDENRMQQHHQAQQDSLFFESTTDRNNSTAMATPEMMTPAARRRLLHQHQNNHSPLSTSSAHRTPTAAAAAAAAASTSAAATRFYRQHRNLSDASIDSSQGGTTAFIDHRRPPAHSHPLPSQNSARGVLASGGERGAAARNLEGYQNRSGGGGGGGPNRTSSGLNRSNLAENDRRRSMSQRQSYEDEQYDGNDRSREEEEEDQIHHLSASPRSISNDLDPYDLGASSSFSNRTTRQHQNRFTAADLDGTAIDDDEEQDQNGRRSPRDDLSRHNSRTATSYRSPRGHHLQQRLDDANYSDQISRPGSILGKPEEDVCFPVHGAEIDLLDLGMSSMHHTHNNHDDDDQTALDRVHHHHHPAAGGVAGVTHNFPFPFDFDALEEFAEREKEGQPIPIVGRRPKFVNQVGTGGGAASGTSPPGYNPTGARGRMGMNASERQGGQGMKGMRQRKLSESVAPGRFQRKLALFEGGLDPSTAANNASILDVKSPLLAATGGDGVGRGRDGARGAGGGGGDGNYGSNTTNLLPSGAGGTARPYRFSFYSNALPSTIHARSLAEIPAEGQTFEELFVGHQTPPVDLEEDNYAEEIRTAFSPTVGSTSNLSQPGTGAHTPVGGGPQSNRTSLNGNTNNNGNARTAGMGTKGATGTTGRMRTEVDAESNTWWLDVLCPTDQEMKVLSKVFGIHPLTTEDIQMEETREKIELFRNYYFVCFRSFEQDPYSPTYLEPLNMYIIVFREGTLSFHFRGTPHPQNVRRRIKQLKDYINVTSDWISYALIDDITDAFGPLIQNIEYEVDSIDELVLILKEAEQSDMLRRIGTCRKKVMGLLRLMGNKADVVKGLYKRCNENWSVAPKSDIGLYLSDIQDHITTSTQNLTHYEKILSRSHSNYLAQISIEMTDANNEINNVLSKLTALGTVLIPMNLITGLWGMNVHVPGQDISEGYAWFLGIIGFLLGIALIGAYASYTLFSRKA